jgi:RNA polymerase sigma-70 factor (ECF subfamily)
MTDTASWSDAELVDAVRGGDTVAFGELYRRHLGAATRAAASLVEQRDLVADAVQDAFVSALERLDTLRDISKFRPWLMSIARHRAIDARRRRAQVVPQEDAGMATEDERPGPEQAVELTELASLVHGCVNDLSQRDATAIAMVTQLGFTPTEVGDALGLSPGAAKVLLHRARRRMKDALVLELMVRRRHQGCDVLDGMLGRDDIVAAASHVLGCATCQTSAGADVLAYGMRRPARGQAVVDKLRAFAETLPDDERQMLAGLLAPGIAAAYTPAEVEGQAMLQWDQEAVPTLLSRLPERSGS